MSSYKKPFEPFEPPVKPEYIVHVDVPPALRPAVTLNQLRSRHGAPAFTYPLAEMKYITKWKPNPMPKQVVTVALLRELLAHTKKTSPYHDGVTYSILASLSDEMLEVLVEIMHAYFYTGNPSGIPEAEFLALRNKFISTCHPILNMVTLWKLLTLTGSHFVVKHVVGQGIIPRCQFAQYPHSSSADVLRVLHDTALSQWETTGEFWMVFDDIVPAYGSMGHTKQLHTLLSGGIDPSVASLMV